MQNITKGTLTTYRVPVNEAGAVKVPVAACCLTDIRVIKTLQPGKDGDSVKVLNGPSAVTQDIALNLKPGSVIRPDALRFDEAAGGLLIEAKGQHPECVVVIDTIANEIANAKRGES